MVCANINSPIGVLGLTADSENLQSLRFMPAGTRLKSSRDPIINDVIEQLKHYFSDPLTLFSINPVNSGTQYQSSIWAFLRTIPPGVCLTYGDISKAAGGSAQSVGNACRCNPMPIITPCHRVISASGLGGFSGQTSGRYMEIKSWLLEHEKQSISEN